ncbi:hypothetical protein UFOVP543_45 [uncultured Caudovirales phage]|uniref:Uncharacterized protein n=1 Tax=uncultured Caudovirales phage TaxID=2100421 RepID=A0A6J5MS08_9CAUD|nr:hypothetical protein UFOVP543_45 [uncultured Caudovirales phage]CAB4163489.1 hypothetical protein UFOVP804_21 [uncultured Caudovirales phage]
MAEGHDRELEPRPLPFTEPLEVRLDALPLMARDRGHSGVIEEATRKGLQALPLVPRDCEGGMLDLRPLLWPKAVVRELAPQDRHIVNIETLLLLGDVVGHRLLGIEGQQLHGLTDCALDAILLQAQPSLVTDFPISEGHEASPLEAWGIFPLPASGRPSPAEQVTQITVTGGVGCVLLLGIPPRHDSVAKGVALLVVHRVRR